MNPVDTVLTSGRPPSFDRVRQPLARGPLALAMLATLGVTAGCAGSQVTLGDIAGAVGATAGSDRSSLSADTIVQGLKEALVKGSEAVVSQLGRQDGFADDPVARIALPDSLQKAADFADRVGLGSYFDDLELKLNRAAEAATPRAKQLFVGAVRQMSVDDARGILNGPDDAATQYFQRTTGDTLTASMRPIVDDALSEVGAVQTFNELLARYRQVPLAPQLDADLTGYVTDQARSGIFHYLAEEERAIRENPLERTSEILQRVFGSRS